MRPVIGVMPLVDDEKDSLWMLPGYFDGIAEAGGFPFMLPLSEDTGLLLQSIDMCDGFLFTGGHDVSPEIYGERPLNESVACCTARDHMEKIILAEALKSDKAVLGICRGIQFINAYMGGSLYQDLPAQHPSSTEHHQQPPYDIPVHTVRIKKGTPLYELTGQDEIAVNSYHHQAVKTIAPCLQAMAVSEDGLIEALYHPEHRFVWATQWHPEFSHKTDAVSKAIFRRFIESV